MEIWHRVEVTLGYRSQYDEGGKHLNVAVTIVMGAKEVKNKAGAMDGLAITTALLDTITGLGTDAKQIDSNFYSNHYKEVSMVDTSHTMTQEFCVDAVGVVLQLQEGQEQD